MWQAGEGTLDLSERGGEFFSNVHRGGLEIDYPLVAARRTLDGHDALATHDEAA